MTDSVVWISEDTARITATIKRCTWRQRKSTLFLWWHLSWIVWLHSDVTTVWKKTVEERNVIYVNNIKPIKHYCGIWHIFENYQRWTIIETMMTELSMTSSMIVNAHIYFCRKQCQHMSSSLSGMFQLLLVLCISTAIKNYRLFSYTRNASCIMSISSSKWTRYHSSTFQLLRSQIV